MLLRASGGVLPEDTVVRVRYGAGAEDYYLADPPSEPEVLFCTPANLDGGPPNLSDAAPPPFDGIEALSCDLWTNGAAIITVTADGYPTLEEQLEPRTDDCGVSETVEVELMLGELDGGA